MGITSDSMYYMLVFSVGNMALATPPTCRHIEVFHFSCRQINNIIITVYDAHFCLPLVSGRCSHLCVPHFMDRGRQEIVASRDFDFHRGDSQVLCEAGGSQER